MLRVHVELRRADGAQIFAVEVPHAHPFGCQDGVPALLHVCLELRAWSLHEGAPQCELHAPAGVVPEVNSPLLRLRPRPGLDCLPGVNRLHDPDHVEALVFLLALHLLDALEVIDLVHNAGVVGHLLDLGGGLHAYLEVVCQRTELLASRLELPPRDDVHLPHMYGIVEPVRCVVEAGRPDLPPVVVQEIEAEDLSFPPRVLVPPQVGL
jgi:hypothetical protein